MILVTGANGVVGKPLCDTLRAQGSAFVSVSRAIDSAVPESISWDMQDSLSEVNRVKLSQVDTLIHCAPIWLLAKQLKGLSQIELKRLIVFSSTSVLSKKLSDNPVERGLVQTLADSERDLTTFCQQQNLPLTILRPTMIYGYGRDQNISHIGQFIQRYGVMFLAGRADGKRQPVHADDLVNACLSIIDNAQTYHQVYNLAGRDVLTYREMVERVFIGLEKKPRTLSIPLCLFRPALIVAAKLRGFSYTPEMADRMNQNLSYDISPAVNDFDYQPQGFLEQPERDLRGVT